MNKQIYNELDDEALGLECIKPTILKIRGKDTRVKSEAYKQLTLGQGALLMFRVLYDHVKNSITDFYCWIGYLLKEPATWPTVMDGMKKIQNLLTLFLFSTPNFRRLHLLQFNA